MHRKKKQSTKKIIKKSRFLSNPKKIKIKIKMKAQKIKTSVLHSFFSISEIGVVALFFLLPYIAVASPITKEIIFKLTNEKRKNQNLILLEQNPILEQVAENKARDIIEKQYFSHTNPEGKPFYEWVDESGYNYAYAGENLAIDFEEAEDAMAAWMASPKHRENILNENYSEIGIGVIDGIFENHPATLIVQIFGRPFMQISKLNQYNFLEEQVYSTLIKGENNDKAITNIPMKNENGFMLNTPLALENNLAEVYESENETIDKASTTYNEQDSKNNNTKLTLSNKNNLPPSNNIEGHDFNILLIISASIILFSIYGSILERVKSSLQIQHHKSQLH